MSVANSKGILRKFATHEAAQAAADKHVQQQHSAKPAIATAAAEQAGAQTC